MIIHVMRRTQIAIFSEQGPDKATFLQRDLSQVDQEGGFSRNGDSVFH